MVQNMLNQTDKGIRWEMDLNIFPKLIFHRFLMVFDPSRPSRCSIWEATMVAGWGMVGEWFASDYDGCEASFNDMEIFWPILSTSGQLRPERMGNRHLHRKYVSTAQVHFYRVRFAFQRVH